MTLTDWIAVIAVAQTAAMMGAGFYVWSAGRRNVDLDGRFRLFKAELENEWKDRQREDRHNAREEMQTLFARLQKEMDDELDDVKRDIDDLRSRLDRGGKALREKA